MDYEKEIPFGAFNSELMQQEINIPEGFEANIKGDKIILKKIESDDDKIRKYLIRYIDNTMRSGTLKSKLLAWLEKQGSQNNTEDEDLLYRFCFYSYKDESNILYLSGLYVNGECRNKGIGTKILEVADEVAKNLNCYAIRLKTEIGSNAERLYRRNGYNTFKREGNNVWLEKQGEQKTDKDMIEALRTEYEKGRHDIIEKAMVWLTSHMKWGVVSWDDKEECVRSFKEAMKE